MELYYLNRNRVIKEIELSYSTSQGKYIKALQLHDTQEILEGNADELRIKLDVYVTHDLIIEILSVGAEVQVIPPASLMNKLNDEHRKYLGTYYVSPFSFAPVSIYKLDSISKLLLNDNPPKTLKAIPILD